MYMFLENQKVVANVTYWIAAVKAIIFVKIKNASWDVGLMQIVSLVNIVPGVILYLIGLANAFPDAKVILTVPQGQGVM